MLQVSNEVKEVQHINFTELLAVEHPKGTRVLFDLNGEPHTIGDPQSAIHCRASDGRDVTTLTCAADSLLYTTPATRSNLVTDSLDFTFDPPPDAQAAKLIVRARNSFWLDYSYGRFLDLFGRKIDVWNASRLRIPPEKIVAWSREQGLELGISADMGNGWQKVGYCGQVGPMALRDIVIPLPLPRSAKKGPLRVKLEFGAMFWEIDYAAVDYTGDLPVTVIALPVAGAIDECGNDIIAAVKNDDTRYYDQPRIGNRATFTFNAPTSDQRLSRTVFLHSKGYYDILRFPAGKPDMAALAALKQPGGFVRFSNERMNDLQEDPQGKDRQ